MERKIICLILMVGLFLGCAPSVRQGVELRSSVDSANTARLLGVRNDLVFTPDEVEWALPDMRDLPLPAPLKKEKRARRYTGIIKNKTRYEVSVPAGDSGSTLIIPAQGWIEYTSWARRFDLTAYYDGKPFYCMKIKANPKTHPFMCKKYDFMIEIVKGEPRAKPVRKKNKKRKARGVEALG